MAAFLFHFRYTESVKKVMLVLWNLEALSSIQIFWHALPPVNTDRYESMLKMMHFQVLLDTPFLLECIHESLKFLFTNFRNTAPTLA